jgi:hypothetical protein
MIALATKHGKFDQIAPSFERLADWQLTLAEIDTDVFGTFTGEIARSLSPKETAIQKAIAGAAAIGCEYGLANEGTIGPHPYLPLVNSDLEIIALASRSTGLVLVESHLSTEIVAYSKNIAADTDVDELVRGLDLPSHAANVFFYQDGEHRIRKGIRGATELDRLLKECLEGGGQDIRVETDFRAMNSPSRQRNITRCAEKLAERLAANCPGCGHFGWGQVGFEYGLPCSSCFEVANSVPSADKFGCVSCDYAELVSLGSETIDPSRCDICNP